MSLKAPYLWRQDTTISTGGTDFFGWAGLPGDNYVEIESITIDGRKFIGFDGHLGYGGFFWSSMEIQASIASERLLSDVIKNLKVEQHAKTNQSSIRCIKD